MHQAQRGRGGRGDGRLGGAVLAGRLGQPSRRRSRLVGRVVPGDLDEHLLGLLPCHVPGRVVDHRERLRQRGRQHVGVDRVDLGPEPGLERDGQVVASERAVETARAAVRLFHRCVAISQVAVETWPGPRTAPVRSTSSMPADPIADAVSDRRSTVSVSSCTAGSEKSSSAPSATRVAASVRAACARATAAVTRCTRSGEEVNVCATLLAATDAYNPEKPCGTRTFRIPYAQVVDAMISPRGLGQRLRDIWMLVTSKPICS